MYLTLWERKQPVQHDAEMPALENYGIVLVLEISCGRQKHLPPRHIHHGLLAAEAKKSSHFYCFLTSLFLSVSSADLHIFLWKIICSE